MKIVVRILIVLAGLAILVSFFYAEEDWRGWHAWQKFKREWEAKGEKFDFASVIPPSVPDDQNFALIADCVHKLWLHADARWKSYSKERPRHKFC